VFNDVGSDVGGVYLGETSDLRYVVATEEYVYWIDPKLVQK
jgi:hypothetical protein